MFVDQDFAYPYSPPPGSIQQYMKAIVESDAHLLQEICPDTLRTIADELGLVALDRPNRSPSLGTALKSALKYYLGRTS